MEVGMGTLKSWPGWEKCWKQTNTRKGKCSRNWIRWLCNTCLQESSGLILGAGIMRLEMRKGCMQHCNATVHCSQQVPLKNGSSLVHLLVVEVPVIGTWRCQASAVVHARVHDAGWHAWWNAWAGVKPVHMWYIAGMHWCMMTPSRTNTHGGLMVALLKAAVLSKILGSCAHAHIQFYRMTWIGIDHNYYEWFDVIYQSE